MAPVEANDRATSTWETGCCADARVCTQRDTVNANPANPIVTALTFGKALGILRLILSLVAVIQPGRARHNLRCQPSRARGFQRQRLRLTAEAVKDTETARCNRHPFIRRDVWRRMARRQRLAFKVLDPRG